MKYLNRFNLINEGWQLSLRKELDYKRENDIREYFEELLDIGLTEDTFRQRMCDSTFFIEDKRLTYNSKSLYPRYTFKLKSESRKFDSDGIIELMQDITEFLERLRGNGYKVHIDELNIIDSKTKDKRMKVIFEFSVYHPDDEIPWEMIFIGKDERGVKSDDEDDDENLDTIDDEDDLFFSP